eukprot:4290671-Prymnesium_polylepis.2
MPRESCSTTCTVACTRSRHHALPTAASPHAGVPCRGGGASRPSYSPPKRDWNSQDWPAACCDAWCEGAVSWPDGGSLYTTIRSTSHCDASCQHSGGGKHPERPSVTCRCRRAALCQSQRRHGADGPRCATRRGGTVPQLESQRGGTS